MIQHGLRLGRAGVFCGPPPWDRPERPHPKSLRYRWLPATCRGTSIDLLGLQRAQRRYGPYTLQNKALGRFVGAPGLEEQRASPKLTAPLLYSYRNRN